MNTEKVVEQCQELMLKHFDAVQKEDIQSHNYQDSSNVQRSLFTDNF